MTAVLPSPCSPEVTTLRCRPVRGPAELAAHHAIRRAVFVDEQRLFDPDDLDAYDVSGATVHVLGVVDGVAAGAVRLYPLSADGLWKGDRLAVLREHRHAGIGGPLVRLAVATARALGGNRMLAQVQAPNVPFFLDLGWCCEGAPADQLGRPHQQMSIPLR